MVNGSIRIRWLSASVRSDNCEKQHIVKMPRRISSRRECGDDEKLAQIALIDSLSPSGRSSRAWYIITKEKKTAYIEQIYVGVRDT
jgi:hypothetical protein